MAPKLGSAFLARSGIIACVLSTILLSTLPTLDEKLGRRQSVGVLYVAGLLLAYTSATVVTSLTTLASIECDGEEETGRRGATLGRFRSRGQLGRALGPLVVTFLYWTIGPTLSFSISSIAMMGVYLAMTSWSGPTKERTKAD